VVSRIFSLHFFPIDEAFSFVVQLHGEGNDSSFVSLERLGILVSFYLLFCGINTTFYNNLDFLRCLILWQCFVFFLFRGARVNYLSPFVSTLTIFFVIFSAKSFIVSIIFYKFVGS